MGRIRGAVTGRAVRPGERGGTAGQRNPPSAGSVRCPHCLPETATAVAVPPLQVTCQALETGSLAAILPITVLLFGTVHAPPPVTTNSVVSQAAAAVMVAATVGTTRNCGVKPRARVGNASPMVRAFAVLKLYVCRLVVGASVVVTVETVCAGAT